MEIVMKFSNKETRDDMEISSLDGQVFSDKIMR
jgi:hypothetical protein